MDAYKNRLKCNREQPCQNCITRNEQSTCIFRNFGNALGNGILPHSPADGMQQRIDRLESLVKKLMVQKKEGQSLKTCNSIDDGVARLDVFNSGKGLEDAPNTGNGSSDRMVMNGDHSIYKNPNDWSAVLKEVHHLSSYALIHYAHNLVFIQPNYEIIN
jgi:hypothetical protein